MATAYFSSHDICGAHDMGSGHPEQPGRLQAIEKGFDVVGVGDRLDRRPAPAASLNAIKRVHDPIYVDELFAMAPSTGRLPIDADTLMTPHSPRSANA